MKQNKNKNEIKINIDKHVSEWPCKIIENKISSTERTKQKNKNKIHMCKQNIFTKSDTIDFCGAKQHRK